MTHLDRARVDPVDGFYDYGYLASPDPPRAVAMRCEACRVKWRGCAAASECPRCGADCMPQQGVG